MDLIRILSVEEARETILKRRPPDETEITPEMSERIRRLFGEPLTPDQVVSRILQDVRNRGDEAARHYTRLIDGVDLDDFRAPESAIRQACQSLSPELYAAMKIAADRIRAFHEKQPAASWLNWDEDGGVGQIVRPLDRVGLYAPGGQAVLFSSLLMAAIPARVAGVRDIVVASPAGRDGVMSPALLAAADLAGVDTVYRIGGAQAIAAMAYGTETIRKVDKILGPGNIFVVLAKKQVFGAVDIDQLPGPTETLIIADASAQAEHVAADLLAQAEHDPMASAILITPSRDLAEQVQNAVARQIQTLPRAEVIRESLTRNGGVVLVDNIDAALELSNAYAPEHLCLLTADPWALVGKVTSAGGIFVGAHSSEAMGDYVTGPSHIMPTGGSARFSSPLSVRDFVKIISLFGLNESASRRLGPAAITLAEAEGLDAHAAAIKRRLYDHESGSTI
jgi:histidinol dehydrogenase